ncbi:MAG: metallophosphoesterase [Cyclobacteriaceae bacterium]
MCARRAIFSFIIGLSIYSCQQPKSDTSSSANQKLETKKSITEIDEAFHFFVLGDWGRNGDHGQKEVADQMNIAAKTVEPEFIISTGDNFYPNGVASVNDPYWKSSFEDIYSGAELFCPWNVVLGNHDYRGNVQAQIDYSNISRRWNMPSRYFYEDVIEDEVSIRFIYLDTSPFEDKYYEELKYQNVWIQDSTAQLNWIDQVMSVDSMDWKIVVGHHPLYSGGKRLEETQDVKGHLEKVFKKHDIDLYLAGHEHDLQHIKPEGPTHYVISGAGSETRKTGSFDKTLFARSIQGFTAISVTKEELFLQFVDLNGEMIYRTSISNHRK